MKAYYVSIGGLKRSWPSETNLLDQFAATSIEKTKDIIVIPDKTVPYDTEKSAASPKRQNKDGAESNATTEETIELDFPSAIEVEPVKQQKPQGRFRTPKY